MTELYKIRAGVARLCHDWVLLKATEDSASATVFVDDYRAYENDNHFRGAELWFRIDQGTVANRGLSARVTSSSLATKSLTLSSGLATAPLTGDECWAFNIGGSGDRMATYDAAINDAIRSLGRAAHITYSADLPDVWDEDVFWVDIPAAFTGISRVQYEDSDGQWIDIPTYAYTVNEVTKQIALSTDFAQIADGYTVKLLGKTVHPELSDDEDDTDVDFEWLTKEVAGSMLLMRRDQLMVNMGGMRKNEADAIRGKAGPFTLMEGIVWVR